MNTNSIAHRSVILQQSFEYIDYAWLIANKLA